MIVGNAEDAGGIVQNFSDRIITLSNEIYAWLSGNLVGILIAAAIGTAIALALIGLRTLGCKMIARGSDTSHWRVIAVRVLSKTNLFFIVFTSAELVGEHANTPAVMLNVIHLLFVIVAAFQAAIWARELILGYVEYRVGPEDESSTLASATSIIRLLVSVALFAVAIVLVLDNVGVNVTGLIAGLGIGGIAIGLAAQGIFSDLFAALSIIFDKPFHRGDAIQFDGQIGTVENIGLKTTRIRSLSGEQVIISNANLLSKQLHNFTQLSHRRMTLLIGLVYQTPPEVCARVPDMLGEIVERHDHAVMIRCGMAGFGASSLDFELVFEIIGTDYEYAFATRSSICLAILTTFNEEKINFAYPTQTTFTAAPDGALVMPYPAGPAGPKPQDSSFGPAPAKSRHGSPPESD